MKMVRRSRLGVAPPRMSFYVGLYAVKKIGADRRPLQERRLIWN
ncbi:replication initiation protein [Streptococcus anginosus]|uniref:Replication initiation protein n=1 Tax=Streptococcus anginosus TaxID=1328 RepID=A0A412PMK7_STRAP|nr:replication initiation protein [Streptococcus anginosus]KAA9262513.1 replication initiation protein [Streptococcus anginosus]KAA9271595.1 replication initiation protein [Streptococcus anginosus]KAA9293059.1 replication initiation protein [Streptococcus anginosus]KAA9305177.1 replication initiation protein [Streptococcus anginosus]